MGGSYWLSQSDSALVIPGIGQNEAGCAEAVMASEQFLTSTLIGIVYFEIDGEILTLRSAAGATLTFEKQ